MRTEVIPIFIGYDPREKIAFDVLAHSIWRRSTEPVSITPLRLGQLPLTRPRHPLQSTAFSFSRFLVPWLSEYHGWSIFMDCDMLCLDDIADLWKLRNDRDTVMVVKHQHEPENDTKFLGAKQTRYPKKNWSSVMMFNNARCRALTTDYVNKASGLDLHQFAWAMSMFEGDEVIGELPNRWNMLVGSQEIERPGILHYTEGGPWFNEYKDCPHAGLWFEELADMRGKR